MPQENDLPNQTDTGNSGSSKASSRRSSRKKREHDFVKKLIQTLEPIPTRHRLVNSSDARKQKAIAGFSSSDPNLQGTKLNVISILGRARKTLDMIYLEVNLSRKALGMKLIPRGQCKKILEQLEALGLVMVSNTPKNYYYLTDKAEPYL
ncbi:MAG: hypothetical protein ACTSW4_01095 [Candidatus Ranarchaeia archaeon]